VKGPFRRVGRPVDPTAWQGRLPSASLCYHRPAVALADRRVFRWRATQHPLFRGDAASGVGIPRPDADPSIVRHILYLDGPGRETPYLSTTESRIFARAGR